MENCCISEDSMLLIRRGKIYSACRLIGGRKVKCDRLTFYPDGALGHPYGTTFEVHDHHLVVSSVHRKDCAEHSSGSDNRGIHDDGSSQLLSQQDITEMKEQGVSGQGIVQSVVEHSSSFKEKTRFAQEKYIKKKEKKHVAMVTILRPSTKALCEMYYARGPSKIGYLRVDTLSQILTMGNVHAHSNVVVMETCQGLLLGAILERMGGFGKLVQVFFGDFPVRFALQNFGHLTDNDQSILLEYPVHKVGTLLDPSVAARSSVLEDISCRVEPRNGDQTSSPKVELHGDQTSSPKVEPHGDQTSSPKVEPHGDQTSSPKVEPHGDQTNSPKVEPHGDQTDESCSTTGMELECVEWNTEGLESSEWDDGPQPTKRPKLDPLHNVLEVPKKKFNWSEEELLKREERKIGREVRYNLAAELLKKKEMDGLIISSRFHPEPILMSLLEFIAPSRPIVVHCHHIEPLVQCYWSLKKAGAAFNIQITDTWTRRYQVIPERTHPEMNMDAHSGYLLTGTTLHRECQ